MKDVNVTTVKLGARGQIVLPAKIRKALSLSQGDEVLVTVSGSTAVVVPKPKSYADRLMGLHREVWAEVDPDSYVREERDSWER